MEVASDLLGNLVRGLRVMELLHDGPTLRCAAEEVVEQLPDGDVTMVATSAEGAALAAVCAALAPGRRLTWQMVNLIRPYRGTTSKVVVVDAIDPGTGWREAVLYRFPDATFVFPRIEVGNEPPTGPVTSCGSFGLLPERLRQPERPQLPSAPD